MRVRATAKELKFNSKKLIYSVNRGEGVIITFRGKPCAKLVPYQEIKNQTEKNELFGMWEDNDMVNNVDEYVRGLRKGRF